MAAPIIDIEGVTKRYSDHLAVDRLSLTIMRSEFFALLGESGCGKTTLLRLMAWFETPDSGRVVIDGQDMAGVPPHRRPVNMMFQSYALFPHLSVVDNVAFGLKMEGVPRQQRATRVAEALALVDLRGLEDRKPAALSGGQRQRVALARALVKQPKVLLLDEPLAALDKGLRERTQVKLATLQDRLGITFVMVTHDQDEALAIACRIAVMQDGRIAQLGTPVDVYERPVSRFVAGFIGTSTQLSGRIRRSSDGATLLDCDALASTLYLAPGVESPGFDVGAEVSLMLRPEVLRLTTTRPAIANAVPGTVEAVVFLGDRTLYHVRSDAGLVLKVTTANHIGWSDRAISWDDRVWVSWSDDAGVVVAA
ncbi:MAG: ABC transporter ATP-binding protein [Alphaproteobacteria bacterium]|nr:ABC transporter ATP-binding protein [Alphaproteobacteria bacterium]